MGGAPVVLPALGCATSDEGKAVTYSLTAKQNYEKGLAELKDENYPEATRTSRSSSRSFRSRSTRCWPSWRWPTPSSRAATTTRRSTATRASSRLHPTHEKVEDGYVAFRIGECYCRTCRTTSSCCRRPTRRISRRCATPCASWTTSSRSTRTRSTSSEAKKLTGARCWRRLVEHEVYVARFYLEARSPQGGGAAPRGRDPPLPGVGARGRSCCWRWARPTCRWAIRSGRKETFAARGRASTADARRRGARELLPGVHPQPLRRQRPRTPPGAPWMSATPAGCCSAGARTTRPANTTRPRRCLTPVVRDRHPYADVYDMLGVIYHQEGRLPDAQAMFERGAAAQPRLHRGGAEPGGHLQRPGANTRRPSDVYERMLAASQGRGARRKLDPFVKGKIANMHAEVALAYEQAGLLRRGDPRVRAGAGAVPDVRRHPHAGWAAASARRATCRRPIRELERVQEGEPASWRARG